MQQGVTPAGQIFRPLVQRVNVVARKNVGILGGQVGLENVVLHQVRLLVAIGLLKIAVRPIAATAIAQHGHALIERKREETFRFRENRIELTLGDAMLGEIKEAWSLAGVYDR